ncbi:MAG TPA: adenylate/guanylate cyclase domain-containing protein [Saprospiraceae bacterium]|nr:adenylate/guanylate cyclase domain-containing protein [Saprospiraceae bacterium]
MHGIRRIQFRHLLFLLLAWQVAAVLMAIYDHLMIHSVFVTIDEDMYSFPLYLLFNVVAALIGGLVAGPLIIFWINEKFINRPYGQAILFVVIIFLVVTTLLILFMGVPYIHYSTGLTMGDPSFWTEYRAYIFNPFQLKKLLAWAIIVALTQFALQLDQKFGHGILWKIILGQYHLPKEEYRVFMFTDLKSSTTIAESIGDVKYHLLLRDFFADVTYAILNNRGSIYNYAGDQVIVSWTSSGNHCVRCFFEMQNIILEKQATYMERYGLVPGFKAGLHGGKVIAGEIGIIKRDITYSGDVLNSTSRIQDKCNELGVKLIISNELLSTFSLDQEFKADYIGTMKLKGKKKEIGLHSIKVK